MKKALGLISLLFIASLMFAQPGTPHSAWGYFYYEDGTTPHENIGIQVSTTVPFAMGPYYYNWPGQTDTANGSFHEAVSGYFQIQLSVFTVNYATQPFDYSLIDNDTGLIYTGSFARGGGDQTLLGDILFGTSGPTNYTISGNIGMAGVEFTGVNTDPATLTTTETGDWSFTAAEGAEVTITPAKEGYSFDPEFFYTAAIDQDYIGYVFTADQWTPNMPMNPYPANGATGIATDLPYLWWDAPEAGVAPTSYFVTFADNPTFESPIIDNLEVLDTMVEVPVELTMGMGYFAQVVPFYAPPARAAMGLKKAATLRTLSKSSKDRDAGEALVWNFTTYAEGENTSHNGGNCNGTDPVTINLPGVTVIIDPIAGVTAVVLVDYTTDEATLLGFGAPALPLPGTTFLFGFNINAGDPSNLNGTIELNVGPGLTITDLFYHNDGAWEEFLAPASWSYDDVTGIITITGLNLSTRTGGDIEIAAHDITLPVTFQSFHATFNQVDGNVLLTWVTQSESDMIGYNVLRSQENDVNTATPINQELIQALNQSSTTTYEELDNEVEPGDYYYWIQAIENGGLTGFHGPVTVTVTDPASDIPEFTVLSNAYPNPFNPKTTIKFSVAKDETAKLTIYNVLGQVVKTYPTYNEGNHTAEWHGIDNNNNPVGSGIYFYRLETESYKKINKMLLLK